MNVLRNELALVTGASGGIGGAISTELAKHSARLILMGRDGAKLLACAEGLRSFTSSVEACACDLTKAEEIEGACAHISDKYGRLGILVHCAGVIQHGNLADAPLVSMDLQYAANVRGPLLLTQRLLPLLKKPRWQIVFTLQTDDRTDVEGNMTGASFYGSIMQASWSFMLALRARGLGSVWTTLHLQREQEAAELLGIPYESVSQIALLPVAYTVGTDFKPAARGPVEDITYWDEWGES